MQTAKAIMTLKGDERIISTSPSGVISVHQSSPGRDEKHKRSVKRHGWTIVVGQRVCVGLEPRVGRKYLKRSPNPDPKVDVGKPGKKIVVWCEDTHKEQDDQQDTLRGSAKCCKKFMTLFVPTCSPGWSSITPSCCCMAPVHRHRLQAGKRSPPTGRVLRRCHAFLTLFLDYFSSQIHFDGPKSRRTGKALFNLACFLKHPMPAFCRI